ncbi:hypothetical protein AGR7A_Lc50175 [Agrobacterium deltaense NCPPB 1641]|uniref:Uncharacterized protein n=1 Tax=Agrobacterium deltaense NCPPB 1641 TaxID=1183425 RepID=A0A1S7U6I3_9HYPH|nr:hypothetical protein AGR7A_Lc50175 [Agrobacterium deltaense NCPPB 1641]
MQSGPRNQTSKTPAANAPGVFLFLAILQRRKNYDHRKIKLLSTLRCKSTTKTKSRVAKHCDYEAGKPVLDR